MSMHEYMKAKEIINTHNKGSFVGQREESLVLKAENALNMNFPLTYRHFLLDFGCGDIFGHEVYGIINDNFENSAIPNGIWLTLNERKTANLPKHLILIAQGYDGYLALDSNQKNILNDFPIIEWIGGNLYNTKEIIYSDFGTYFLEIVAQK